MIMTEVELQTKIRLLDQNSQKKITFQKLQISNFYLLISSFGEEQI